MNNTRDAASSTDGQNDDGQRNDRSDVSHNQADETESNSEQPAEVKHKKNIWSDPLTFVIISIVISVALLIFGIPMIPMTKDERLELIHSPAAMKCRSEGYNEGTCFGGSVTYFIEAIGSALLMLGLITIALTFLLKAIIDSKKKQPRNLVPYLIVLDIFLVAAASIPYLLYLVGGLF